MRFMKIATILVATYFTLGLGQQITQAAVPGDTTFAYKETIANVYSDTKGESDVIGTFGEGAKATIVGEDQDYYKIISGSVEGFVKKAEVVSKEEAQEYAKQVGTDIATIQADLLIIRQQPNTGSDIIDYIPKDKKVEVLSEFNGWLYIEQGEKKGYICGDYVTTTTEFKTALTTDEMQAKLEEEKRILEEQQRKEQQQTIRQDIVNFALQFVGNPYVYGGTSLTNGTDCSGFTQSIYANFGYQIPRSSREQDDVGTAVSVDTMEPGDLLFYASGGTVNHVALYIGNGEIVHASSAKTGIKVSNYNYRQPVKVVSIL